MTKKEELMIVKARLNNVVAKGKNLDCPGVERKLRRKIRNLEKEVN